MEQINNLFYEIQGYYGTDPAFGIISLKIENDNCIGIDYYYYNVSNKKLMRIKQHICFLVKERIGYKTSFHQKNI